MMNELTGVYIEGEGFVRVESAERFAQLLKERLGQDVADMFEQLRTMDMETIHEECDGECDRLYELQGDYESAINEALDQLSFVEPKGEESRENLFYAKDILRGALR